MLRSMYVCSVCLLWYGDSVVILWRLYPVWTYHIIYLDQSLAPHFTRFIISPPTLLTPNLLHFHAINIFVEVEDPFTTHRRQTTSLHIVQIAASAHNNHYETSKLQYSPRNHKQNGVIATRSATATRANDSWRRAKDERSILKALVSTAIIWA